ATWRMSPPFWAAGAASLPVILLCPIVMVCAAAVTSSPRCRLDQREQHAHRSRLARAVGLLAGLRVRAEHCCRRMGPERFLFRPCQVCILEGGSCGERIATDGMPIG